MSPTKPAQDNGRSSMYEKITPDLRRRVDIALLERVPATYREVYMAFELHEYAVTYMSFYRYARRIRDRGNIAELANIDADTETDLTPAINKLAARQLLEILLNEDTFDPRAFAALTASIDRLSRFDSRQHARADANALTRRRLDQNDIDLQLKSEQLQLIRERLQYLRDSRDRSVPAPMLPAPAAIVMPKNGTTMEDSMRIAASNRTIHESSLGSEPIRRGGRFSGDNSLMNLNPPADKNLRTAVEHQHNKNSANDLDRPDVDFFRGDPRAEGRRGDQASGKEERVANAIAVFGQVHVLEDRPDHARPEDRGGGIGNGIGQRHPQKHLLGGDGDEPSANSEQAAGQTGRQTRGEDG
jgi:hypothetical protein